MIILTIKTKKTKTIKKWYTRVNRTLITSHKNMFYFVVCLFLFLSGSSTLHSTDKRMEKIISDYLLLSYVIVSYYYWFLITIFNNILTNIVFRYVFAYDIKYCY